MRMAVFLLSAWLLDGNGIPEAEEAEDSDKAEDAAPHDWERPVIYHYCLSHKILT